MEKRFEAKKRLSTARSNLLAVILFSAINILLTLFNTGVTFLFSALCPALIIQIGNLVAAETRNPAFLWIASAIAVAIIALYVMCYFLSKKRGVFILIALILFSLDTLVLAWTLTLGFETGVLIDLAFHIWVSFYLIIGTKAWLDLKKLPIAEYSNESARPLREASAVREIILSQTYGNLDIAVMRTEEITELIVNGSVYVEKIGVFELNSEMYAFIEDSYYGDGTHIRVTMDASSSMNLYINETLLATKKI